MLMSGIGYGCTELEEDERLGPRDILNKLKWCGQMRNVRITILHRGAPGNQRTFTEREIARLGKSFIHIRSGPGEVQIPYHRILRIEAGKKVLWEK